MKIAISICALLAAVWFADSIYKRHEPTAAWIVNICETVPASNYDLCVAKFEKKFKE